MLGKFFYVIVVFFFFSYPAIALSAQKILEYGFEEWTGDMDTTPGYPVSSTYTEYCTTHENATEVVTSYNGWAPHSGNRFLLQNDSSTYALNPPVSGITAGTVNAHNNYGLAGSGCRNDTTRILSDITTGEIFVRFWARTHGFNQNIEGGRCKWIRVYADDSSTAGTIYMHTATGTVSPRMFFYNGAEPDVWLEDPTDPDEGNDGGVVMVNSNDGNWHKYSFYINYNTGVVRGWYDVATETAENATKEYRAADGAVGGGSRPDYLIIQGNFSAKNPQQITYHALDDIEVWDGMPVESPSPVDNAPVVALTSPSSSTYSTSDSTFVFSGTSSDDNSVSSIGWSNNRGGSGSAVNDSGDWSAWSVSGCILVEGDNVITVMASDGVNDPVTDTVTVTYSPSIVALAAPGYSAVIAAVGNKISMNWESFGGSLVAQYRILRNGTEVLTTVNRSYVDSGLAASTQYAYTVIALDGSGNSLGQIVLRATTD